MFFIRKERLPVGVGALSLNMNTSANSSETDSRPLALVAGASTGIGYHLAKECAENGFDLLIADEAKINEAAKAFRRMGGTVDAVEADLSTTEGVDTLCAALKGRPVYALLANAGHRLGKGFLDQDFKEARHVLYTNVTGTIYLLHKVGKDMRAAARGAFSSPARSPGLSRELTRPFTMAPRLSWILSLSLSAPN